MALFDVKPKADKPTPKKEKKQTKFINPEQFNQIDLPIAQLIQRRRLQMLVLSSLYYDYDTSLVTDSQFDKWARELVELQSKYPRIAEQLCYHEDFKDWDASTGAFLPIRDGWVMKKVRQLLETKEEYE